MVFFISPKCLGGRVENPKKVFQVGDKVEVMIKDIHDTKIALSLKFPGDKSMGKMQQRIMQ